MHSLHYQKPVTMDDLYLERTIFKPHQDREGGELLMSVQCDAVPGPSVFHQEVQRVVEEHELQIFGQYLEFYNLVDVKCMMSVIDQMLVNFEAVEPLMEIGRNNVSLLHIFRVRAHKSAALEAHAQFFLPKGDVQGHHLEQPIHHCLYGSSSSIDFGRHTC